MNTIQFPRRFVKEDWGGTETVVLETSKQLLQMGHPTEIFCTLATAHERHTEIGGVHVTRFPYFYPYLGLSKAAKRTLDRKGGSPFSFSVMRALQQYPDLDILHLHCGNRIGGIGRYVARQRRIPYVVSLHGGLLDMPEEERLSLAAPMRRSLDLGKPFGWWVGSRKVLADAAAIVCVGQREQMLMQERAPEKRVVYLPNGVDAAHFEQGDRARFRSRHGIPEDAFMLLTVARIDSQKNQLGVAQMMPDLVGQIPNAHAVFVGPVTNTAYYEEIRKTLQENGQEKRVTIITGLDADSQELVDAYHAADLFLLSSVAEPFGIVILEAWAAGCPVVASDIGGVPFFVEEGVDGVLFDVNEPGAMVQAIVDVAQHPGQLQAMAAAGQQKAQQEYSWERITEKLVRLYEEVIDENPLR